jgi:putative ABC transport system permease protein
MPDPSWAQEVRKRLSSLRLAPTREAEIVDELSQHLDDRYRELIAGGASPDEARRLTLADFRDGSALSDAPFGGVEGNVLARQMATLRQAHAPSSITPGAPTGHVLSDLWQDLRYAARMFWKQPGFAATAVLTLALGIGATTAIFSVVNGVLLKPLPFDEPERLVSLRQLAPHGAGTNHGPATYLTYRENQRAFEAIGAWDPAEVSITRHPTAQSPRGGDPAQGGDPERVQALLVSASTLPLLRVQPLMGRGFSAEDDTPGNPLRVVLTHGYWQRRFGGTEHVVGQPLVIDGRPAEVIGVLPPSFKFLRTRPAILLPLPLDVNAPRGISFGFQALARLKPSVTLAQANADVARMISLLPPVFARLELQPNVGPLADDVIGNIGQILWILLAAVGVVLLIACGNVANLFLVRAEGRHQEFAMRAALGASRGRIARALLSESVVLALAGGVLGVALAQAAIGLLRTIAPAELPRVDDISIDPMVLLFTISISIVSGLLFGLVAVVRFGTPNATALTDGGRSATAGPGRHRTRNALVVGQVALALTLLIVSGLMIRTFIAMRQVDPGFTRPREVQTFVLAIPPGLISDPQQAARTHESVAERLARVPGVASVGLSSSITMDGEDNGNYIAVEEFPDPEGAMARLRRFKSFAPGYFETMGNRLVAGRSITWSEIHERRPVIVISAPLAREYWGEPAKALGKRVRTSPRNPWREIVGVVGDERDDGVNQPATAIVYWPMLSESYRWRTMAYAVRSNRVGTPGFLRELEQAVWSVNPNLPLASVQTLEEIQARSMAQTSFALVMLGIAASVALFIGVVGIYGVIAYAATQRTREIGVRMALGAQIGDVRRLFLRQGLRLTATGIALGIGVALVLTRVMSAFLFGVGPMDPMTYAAVSGTLAAIALLATYLPARRASSVDPMVALRADF